MEKLTVTLEDRPVDIELAQYKRMFEAACSALAAIGDALGVDPEEGGAEPILAAIADLKASDSRPVKQEPVAWEVIKKCIKIAREHNNSGEGGIIAKEMEKLYTAPQPVKQEPVAKLTSFHGGKITFLNESQEYLQQGTLFYTHPVRTKDLTDDEIEAAVLSVNTTMEAWITYRAVIAAYKEKNK